jgi:hypothetical protein
MKFAERWQRAGPGRTTMGRARQACVDFFEGRHYTADQIAELARQGRPHFKFNVIAPLVRLILGYQATTRPTSPSSQARTRCRRRRPPRR